MTELVFTLAAVTKLEKRGISTAEVRDIPWNRYRVEQLSSGLPS